VETISSALINRNNQFIGVAAYDFTDIIDKTEWYNKIKFKKSGFAVLLSADGLVLTDPPVWQNNERLYRIYEESVTGINFN
jgi:hypothetical protein